ncbi:MAG: hypothetical protein ACLQPD_05985 [Desulfomonilaceae bacterium]
MSYLVTFQSGSTVKILIDLGCVVRYGQQQEKAGFLHQRDGGFVSVGSCGRRYGSSFGVKGGIFGPVISPKTLEMSGAPHNGGLRKHQEGVEYCHRNADGFYDRVDTGRLWIGRA